MRFRIPDPPFHPRGGVAQHLYTAKYPSFGLRWSHRFGLTDSHGSHPLWALPRLNLPAVSGSLSHPLRDRHAPQCPCTALVPAMPRWRRPDASISAITSHRVLLALAHPSLWDHPLSMVLVYHRRARLSRVFGNFFREFSHRKACTLPLGVPLLGYDGRPSEGLGSASPPDTDIISYPHRNGIANVGKFSTKSYMGGPAY